MRRKRESIIQDPLLSFHLKSFQTYILLSSSEMWLSLDMNIHLTLQLNRKIFSSYYSTYFLLKLKILTWKIYFFSENTPEISWITVTLSATVSKVFKNNCILHHSHHIIWITWKRKRNFAFNLSSHTSFSCILKINSIPWCDFPLPIQHFKST